VVAGVSGSAVSDRAWVVFCWEGNGTDGAGVIVCHAPLRGVPVLLASVASGSGTEGDVFSDVAFSVAHCEAAGTKGLLGHLPNEGDDH
jgi:hypothetical protein